MGGVLLTGETTTATSLDNVLSAVPTVLDVCTDVIAFITSEPLLVIPVAVSLVGIGVSLFKRLQRG